MQKSASAMLREAAKATTLSRDIFLSHSVHDAQLVAGFKVLLEHLGVSVFVDWIDAPQLDRRDVTPTTAEAVVPILERSTDAFAGTEYLGLYPYVDYAMQSGTVSRYLWVRDSTGKSERLDRWLAA